ncbi:MAG: Hsp20/alpha crystallin family protein [Salinimicrobium sp.]
MSLVKSNSKRQSPAMSNSFVNDPFFSDFMIPRWGMLNRLIGDQQGDLDLTPAMNVQDSKKDIQIELAAPGLKKDDFHITLDDGILTISAEKENKEEEKKEGYYRKEFSYNSFTRSVRLPESIDEDKDVEAKYNDGVLKLTLHKKNETQQKKQKSIKVS